MVNFGRKSKDEIQNMTEDEFFKYMEEWDRYTAEKLKNQKLTEAETPQFKSVEEARKYFGAISFDEFEQRYLK